MLHIEYKWKRLTITGSHIKGKTVLWSTAKKVRYSALLLWRLLSQDDCKEITLKNEEGKTLLLRYTDGGEPIYAVTEGAVIEATRDTMEFVQATDAALKDTRKGKEVDKFLKEYWEGKW